MAGDLPKDWNDIQFFNMCMDKAGLDSSQKCNYIEETNLVTINFSGEEIVRCVSFTIIVMLLLVSLAFSTTISQSDWSSGPGVLGPVLDWGNSFHNTDGIGFDVDGMLQLALSWLPVEHSVGDLDGAVSVYSADVDGDGDLDVLGAGAIGYDIIWWENTDGTGTSWIEHTIDDNYIEGLSVYSADIDGDGDADVLGAANGLSAITWWENTDGTGTSWIEHTIDGNYLGAWCVHSADMDGDGDMDVLGAASNADDITWWENTDGAGTAWIEHLIDGNFDGARSVYSADVDGDGDLDVLGAASNANDITWWENVDGAGTAWIKFTIDEDFNGATGVYFADINDDGDMDVLGAAINGDEITWWENNDGAGTAWTKHLIAGNFDGARTVYSADFDNDGDMDVLGAAMTSGKLTLWENLDGAGTAWIEHSIDDNLEGSSLAYSADINGDGNTDVLGGAYHEDLVAWWDISLVLPTGTLESSILDLERLPEWNSISWTSTEPEGTSVGVQLRSSENYSVMGEWSDTLFTSGVSLSGVINDSTQFVQYRLILETENVLYSPLFEEIAMSFLELITVLSPDEYTIWSHGLENAVLAWEYETDKSFLQGDSVSIELFKGSSLIANLTGGNVVNTGQFIYPGPIPTSWEPGVDYHLVITDDVDNYGYSAQFEIQVGAAIENSASLSLGILQLPFSPNPIQGTVQTSIAVLQTTTVGFSIYDITGRIVRSTSRIVEAGYHNINLGELNPGIYFCRMVTENYTDYQRFAVIK